MASPPTPDAPWRTDIVIAHSQLLARSLKHWTGRGLLPENAGPAKLAEKIFRAPFVLVSHGTEPDPVLNYGNAAALGRTLFTVSVAVTGAYTPKLKVWLVLLI